MHNINYSGLLLQILFYICMSFCVSCSWDLYSSMWRQEAVFIHPFFINIQMIHRGLHMGLWDIESVNNCV
jgi:hypothetical protein